MIQPADIRRLLDAFEQSDWEEIRLSIDGTDVLISAADNPAGLPSQSKLAAPAPAAPAPAGASVEPHTTAAASIEVPPGTAVTSPSPGIFWRSPAPGAPPFVEVGQHVEAESVVCIVEVMKLMNRVVAGVSGKVVAILVENSEKVARDQPLVVIDPDG